MSIYKFCMLFVLISFQVVLYSQSPEIPSGCRLRTIVEERFPDDSFLLGATTGAWTFGKLTSIIMDREFNYVTPENDFKQWNIHPDNSGGQLTTVIANETFTAGTYGISLNTERYLKQSFYLLRITSGDHVKTIKLMSGFKI